jgi:ubiquinone/menaquinone biosynthesis C-methylase UbiE
MIGSKLERIALAFFAMLFGLAAVLILPSPAQVRQDFDKNDIERDARFPMDAVLDSLGLRPGMTVGEIGAGWGYLTFKLARRVAPDGLVLAEDIEPRWLDLLKKRADVRGITNFQTILGKETDPHFPPGKLDFIFVHAVLKWIEDRPGFLRIAGAGLKPGGHLIIIEPETEGDDPEVNVVGAGGYPTRPGYLELFRRAGFEVVSAERKPDWRFPVFVIEKKPGRP